MLSGARLESRGQVRWQRQCLELQPSSVPVRKLRPEARIDSNCVGEDAQWVDKAMSDSTSKKPGVVHHVEIRSRSLPRPSLGRFSTILAPAEASGKVILSQDFAPSHDRGTLYTQQRFVTVRNAAHPPVPIPSPDHILLAWVSSGSYASISPRQGFTR
jgi:hypothetical protein